MKSMSTAGKTAVILSGGLGTRLKPLTSAIPKPLLPIGEKAVLEIQIERLARFGYKRVILATNYKGAYIERFFGNGSAYGIQLEVSREEQPLGTAGPLSLLADELDEPFLVMNGDVLCLTDLEKMYDHACESSALFTAGVKKIVTPYSFGNIHFDGDVITGIEEKPDIVTWALAGIYVLKPAVIDLIPRNTYFGIDQLIQGMLERNMLIKKYEIDEYWLDIGRMDDFEKAQNDYARFSDE